VKLSVGVKIGGGFLVLLLLISAVAIQALVVMNSTISNSGDVKQRVERLNLDYQIADAFKEASRDIRAYMLYGDAKYAGEYTEDIAQTKQLLEERLNNCSAEAKPKLQEVLSQVTEYDGYISGQVIPLVRQGNTAEAVAKAQQYAHYASHADEILKDLVQANREKTDKVIATMTGSAAGGRSIVLLISGVAVLVGLVTAVFVTRAITGPVKIMMDGVNRMAVGDFTQAINIKAKDEIGQLAQALNQMREQLKGLIANIMGIAQSLAAHSEELAASTEEVSATIEEVAGTTSEVSNVSQQGTENALAAAEDARHVLTVAQKGNEAVADTVAKINGIAAVTQQVNAAVQELGTISKQIGDIINVITGIADQTNLLALNAAIEAARAGEQGRGFAVVAEEVRKLAEQSANAAKEIAGLITRVQSGVSQAVSAMDKGITEVQSGVQVANTAGRSLQEIIEAVKHTVELIRDVAEGSKQTNEGTQQLTAATEQISSSIQEVAAAAAELSKMGEKLSESVTRFKV